MDESMNKEPNVNDWGVDLDPKNRPAYPKEKKPKEGTGAHWTEPEQQIPMVKVYHSIERPGLTPVFGTTCPPTGLSGRLRDVAYRYSEAQFSHWMLLLLADRINVVEGIVDDIRRGRIPNPFSEMGLKSEWKHNRKNVQRNALIAGCCGLALGALAFWMKRDKAPRFAYEDGAQ